MPAPPPLGNPSRQRHFTMSVSPARGESPQGARAGQTNKMDFSGLMVVGQQRTGKYPRPPHRSQSMTWPRPRPPATKRSSFQGLRIKTIPEHMEEEYQSKSALDKGRGRRQAVCVTDDSELTQLEKFVLHVIMPTLTKPGFQMSPQLDVIQEMTQAQMKRVSNFKVEREGVGSMEWLQPVDLMCADLDLIQLEKGKVGFDPEELESLNSPCTIQLQGLWPKAKSSPEELRRFPLELKWGLEQVGAEFVSYDMKTGELTFRCTQFNQSYDLNVVIENPPAELPNDNYEDSEPSPEIVSTPAMAWRIMGWALRDRHLVRMAMMSVYADGDEGSDAESP